MEKEFITAYVQSSLLVGMNRYTWRVDMKITKKEIIEAFHRVCASFCNQFMDWLRIHTKRNVHEGYHAKKDNIYTRNAITHFYWMGAKVIEALK